MRRRHSCHGLPYLAPCIYLPNEQLSYWKERSHQALLTFSSRSPNPHLPVLETSRLVFVSFCHHSPPISPVNRSLVTICPTVHLLLPVAGRRHCHLFPPRSPLEGLTTSVPNQATTLSPAPACPAVHNCVHRALHGPRHQHAFVKQWVIMLTHHTIQTAVTSYLYATTIPFQ
jgi:hypothetical protein